MTKKELAGIIAEKTECTKADAAKAFDALFSVIENEVISNGSLKIQDFGTFKLVTRAARKSRNPQTGETVDVPAKKTIVFKPGKSLKARLNG